EEIGNLISDALMKTLDEEDADGDVLIVAGSPTDNAAKLIKKGMLAGVKESDFDILAEYDTPDWNPQMAQDWVAGQITKYRGEIAGVVAANEGTAGGTIAAMKAAGVDPLQPVPGNDAEVAASQHIVVIQHITQ